MSRKIHGAALRGASDHHAVGTGVVEHPLRVLRRRDVAVRDHRQAGRRLHLADRIVLGGAAEAAGAGATVDGEEANPGLFRNARDAHRIPVSRIPAGADLEGDRDAHRPHDGVEDARHQGLVAQQRRPGGPVADLLRGAAHVDVDDLGAAVDVFARGIRHHGRIGAGDLHRDRLGLAAMVGAAARLLGRAQARVRRHHFRHREPRAEALAELAEGPIGHACHRCDKKAVPQHVRADLHSSRGGNAIERSAILRSKIPTR